MANDKDMMIDTNDYDVFSQLEDHLEVVESKPVKAKAKEDYTEDYDDTDYDADEDLDVDEDEDTDYDDDDDFDEGKDEDLDVEEVKKEEVSEMLKNFEALDDDLVIKIGDREMTKAEASEILKADSEVKQHKQVIDTFVQQFDKERVIVEQTLYGSLSETELMKQNVMKKLNDPDFPSVEKGQLYEDLRRLEERQKVLNARAQEYSAAFQRREDQAILYNLNNVNSVMSKKYSDWDQKSGELASYIESTGVNAKAFLKAVTPQLMDSLLKAMKYDKKLAGKDKELRETLKRKPGAVKAVKGKPHTRSKSGSNRKDRDLIKRMNSGRLTSDDITNSFYLLKD